MFRDMNRLTKGVLITTLSLIALLVVGSLAGNFYLGVRLSNSQAERADTSAALDQVQEEYNGLYREYTDATGGEPDAATPSQVNETVKELPGKPGTPGATGAQGPRGMMGERGQDGPPGPVGPSGAPGAVGGVGAAGAAGVDGLNGATGSKGADGAPGGQGPAGPAGEPGAPGADGAPGPQGMDGRGITDVMCGEDGSWIISYTDGSSSVASGPCRVLVAPGVE